MSPRSAGECPARLTRRQILHRGIAALGGAATLSALKALFPLPALAQLVEPDRSFRFLHPPSAHLPSHIYPSLLIATHAYRYDWRAVTGGAGDPAFPPLDLITYRFGSPPPAAAPFLDTRLSTEVRPAPFPDPTIPPGNPFPPAPTSVRPPTRVVCHRLELRLDPQTIRIFDWCTFYCSLGDLILITDGREALSYVARPDGHPPGIRPLDPVDFVNPSPEVTVGWTHVPAGTLDTAVGNVYYAARMAPGSLATATWTTPLNHIDNGRALRVEAFIPGGYGQAHLRTTEARYRVQHAGVSGWTEATISQQVERSRWAPLGVLPFRSGSFRIQLTTQQQSPIDPRLVTQGPNVVANAVRYVDP